MFLPIGTICLLRNYKNYVTVVGYDETGKFRGIKFSHDLNSKSIFEFSKNDIIAVFHLGYCNDEIKRDAMNLIQKFDSMEKEDNLQNLWITKGKYSFNDDGVVLTDNSQNNVESGIEYKFDENGVVTADTSKMPKSSSEEDNFEEQHDFIDDEFNRNFDDLDENYTDEDNKNSYEYDTNTTETNENDSDSGKAVRKTFKSGKYKFDENGVVIGE